jgi:hypothetical protein
MKGSGRGRHGFDDAGGLGHASSPKPMVGRTLTRGAGLLARAFDVMDFDNIGCISANRFAHYLHRIGLTHAEVEVALFNFGWENEGTYSVATNFKQFLLTAAQATIGEEAQKASVTRSRQKTQASSDLVKNESAGVRQTLHIKNSIMNMVCRLCLLGSEDQNGEPIWEADNWWLMAGLSLACSCLHVYGVLRMDALSCVAALFQSDPQAALSHFFRWGLFLWFLPTCLMSFSSSETKFRISSCCAQNFASCFPMMALLQYVFWECPGSSVPLLVWLMSFVSLSVGWLQLVEADNVMPVFGILCIVAVFFRGHILRTQRVITGLNFHSTLAPLSRGRGGVQKPGWLVRALLASPPGFPRSRVASSRRQQTLDFLLYEAFCASLPVCLLLLVYLQKVGLPPSASWAVNVVQSFNVDDPAYLREFLHIPSHSTEDDWWTACGLPSTQGGGQNLRPPSGVEIFGAAFLFTGLRPPGASKRP